MLERIKELAQRYEKDTIAARRDFHKHAEVAWTEFRTAAIVADRLTKMGYQVLVGDEVIDEKSMMGLPSPAEIEKHMERALAQGANPQWVKKMAGGKTGVVGVLEFGRPGPTVALRFDMDANDALESTEEAHRPFREDFASINKGAMHACAHDGHTAVGLSVARILAELKNDLAGKIKLIFQPAEEGSRGAKAMMMKGVVDDVDYFFCIHFGTILRKLGQISTDAGGFLATTKIDAEFTGKPAHAGIAPETGRNALLAAATALLNIHAISRHGKGTSRVNVGVMQGGTGRNVIPANALLKLETRGITSEINEYMYEEAIRILKGAAAMHDVQVSLKEMGGAAGCNSDRDLGEKAWGVAEKMGLFDQFLPQVDLGFSEDATYFMERVQQKGGKAAYVIIGTELAAGHHEFRFDINEEVLSRTVAFVAGVSSVLLTGR